MPEQDLTRRRLLAASLPVAVGLAGCSGDGGDGEATGTDGTDVDTTSGTESTESVTTESETTRELLGEFPSLSPAAPTYRNWVPGTGPQRGVFDAAYNVGRLRATRSSLPASRYESLGTFLMLGGYVGVEYDELDGLLTGLSGPIVYLGSFTREDVVRRLGDTRYEQFRTDAGVTYFRRTETDPTALLGVGAEGVVLETADPDADSPGEAFVDRTRTLFETTRGERPRLHEESARYATYTDTMGWPLVVVATPPRPLRSGGVGVGNAFPGSDQLSESARSSLRYGKGQYLTDGALVERAWLRLDDGASVTPAEIRETYASAEVREAILGDDQSLAVRTGSGTVDIARRTPVTAPGGGVDPVLVTLDVTVEAGTATVDHVAGDDLPLDRVTVRAGTEQRSLGSGTLSAGESTSVAVPADTTQVRVVYAPPATDTRTVLAGT